VHLPRWLKERNRFLFDQHNGTGARVAAGMGSSPAPRKYPEAAEFNAVSSAQRRVDRAQDRADETLNITLVETRILRGDAVDKLGFDHRVVPHAALAQLESQLLVRMCQVLCCELGMVGAFCELGVDLVERALERVCNGTEAGECGG
jgi:hypothetical protein